MAYSLRVLLNSVATSDSLDPEAEFTSRVLYASSDLSITLDCCLRRDHSISGEECWEDHVLIFPLSGVNVMQIGGASVVVDPSQVTLTNRGEAYRVSHPHGSGEAAINVTLRESALLEILQKRGLHGESDRPFSRNQIGSSPALYLNLLQLLSMTQPIALDALAAEECGLSLVDGVAQGLAERESLSQIGGDSEGDRDLAEAAAALLAGRYREPLSLDQLTEALPASKFRLCRVFKQVTGETLWQRLQQLRARAAATEIADGPGDLSRLALALGFSSHSHFSASFRRVFGITPSALRGWHTGGSSKSFDGEGGFTTT